MTDKQPEALRLADEVDEVAKTFPDMAEVSACIRTQHAEIERLNAAAADSNLILERAQAANLEMLAEIERLNSCLKWEQARANLEAENQRLREALQEAAVHIAARWGDSDPHAIKAFTALEKQP